MYFRVKILDRESIGISTIVKRIINGYTPSNFNQFPPDLVKQFLENITILTCQFSEGASNNNAVENVSYNFLISKCSKIYHNFVI